MLSSWVDVLTVGVIIWLVQESRIFQQVVIKSQIVFSTAAFSPTASDDQYKQQKRQNRSDGNKARQETCKRKRRDLAPVCVSAVHEQNSWLFCQHFFSLCLKKFIYLLIHLDLPVCYKLSDLLFRLD